MAFGCRTTLRSRPSTISWISRISGQLQSRNILRVSLCSASASFSPLARIKTAGISCSRGPARAAPWPAGRAGPQPMGRAGPGFNYILRAGPGAGLKLAGPGRARAGPGLVYNNFAVCGPGLGLTFPGLGRARAYSESHSF